MDYLIAQMGICGMKAGMVLNNFWAWTGAAHLGYPWIGDPPNETPGWYSVHNMDSTTLAIIGNFAQKMTQLDK